jgi:hypothetical protein
MNQLFSRVFQDFRVVYTLRILGSCFFRPARYSCTMIIKLSRARGHTYSQVVESLRDAKGQPRQRNLLSLGRADETSDLLHKIHYTLFTELGGMPMLGSAVDAPLELR